MGEAVDTMAQVIDTMAGEQHTMRRGEITMANLRGTKGFGENGVSANLRSV